MNTHQPSLFPEPARVETQPQPPQWRYEVYAPDGDYVEGYSHAADAMDAYSNGYGYGELDDDEDGYTLVDTLNGRTYEPGDWPETEEPNTELMTAPETHAHVASLIRQSQADHDTAVMLAERAKAIFGVDIAPTDC